MERRGRFKVKCPRCRKWTPIDAVRCIHCGGRTNERVVLGEAEK